MLNRSDDARTSIIADYSIAKNPSRRSRRPHERAILAAHHEEVRVIELVGTLSFSNVDYVSRQLAGRPRPQFVIFDLHRVTSLTRAGARLVAEAFAGLAAENVTVILAGVKRDSREWGIIREWTGGLTNVRDFFLLDAAIEWAEDQLIFRYGGAIDLHEMTELSEQPLLAGLSPEELTDLTSIGAIRHYRAGEKIVAAGDPAISFFFLRSGAVHVTLPDGVRLATLTAGMAFGEMALLEPERSADVLADGAVTAVEVPLKDFERFRTQHPHAGERIMRNLAQLLADRLIVANIRVDLLSSS
jgi:glutaminase